MAEKNFIDEIFSDENNNENDHENNFNYRSELDKIIVTPNIKNMTLKDHFRLHVDTILYEIYMKYDVPLNMIKIIKLYIQNY